MLIREIGVLIRKEFDLEIRNKVAIGGILLYVVTTVFLCYLSFRELQDTTVWNTLFWVILLFSALNTISKSFQTESRYRLLYLYTLVSPAAVILSKMIYNILLMGITALVTLLFYSLFLGTSPLEGANAGMYLVALLLGCAGFAGIFTMIAAIAAKTGNQLGIMAILGFPLILPLLLTLIGLSGIALRGLPWEYGTTELLILTGLNILIAALSYILFPYLWRE
ncbi:MAG TPA: ABC transporter permease [Flavobacteriales bacterium]|nr:ABC transporter permease [Flavobacteriales bacterium]HCA83323.1 ABC transporter permease [Flavobacteriales bacterium]HRE74479.1 heme exporter protein CcmB [Flavobacteriales bacterium]HRJ35787.1 heme exporter protein CcmB [Flavobacteriales bacterium]HRJ37816.1 heme exporter protein CcmB [Flavobacteriales bacterium]